LLALFFVEKYCVPANHSHLFSDMAIGSNSTDLVGKLGDITMQKKWYTLTALLLLGSVAVADELNYWDSPVAEPISAAADITGGLTPRKPQVILAQQGQNPVQQVSSVQAVPPAPVLSDESYFVAAADTNTAQAAPADTSAVYAELQRLSDTVEQIKKNTAKPDTKKAWSSPKISGRVFYDSYTVDQPHDGLGNFKNKAGIREGRIAVSGNGFDSFDYKFEIGLNSDGNGVNLYDTWLGAKNVPLLGYFRVGHYRIETGVGIMQSGLHTTLTEFAAPSRTFGFGRKLGFSSEHLLANDRIRLFSGLFNGTSINSNPKSVTGDDQGILFNTRLTFAPYYSQDGRYLLSFGGHYVYNNSNSADPTGLETLSARAGGLDWMGNALTTGSITTNHSNRSGLEAVYQAGAFNIRTEAFWAKFAGDANDGKTASGFSTELSYFLTGENRSYNLSTATFGAVKPKRNFHPFKSGEWNLIDGWGAWQAVLQYAYTDLSDWREGIAAYPNPASPAPPTFPRGGLQNDVTFGVNWFWTSNIRMIFEYTHSQQNIGTNYVHNEQDIFGTSVRVFF
jgi:phosphate-selective porin OprO/OprP